MEHEIKALEKLLNTFYKKDINNILSKYSIDYVKSVKITDRKSEFEWDMKYPNFIVRVYMTNDLPDKIVHPMISYLITVMSLMIQGNFTIDTIFIDHNNQIFYNILSGKRFINNTSKEILMWLEDSIKDYYDIDNNG